MYFDEIHFPASDREIVVWWMIVTKINMADDEETNEWGKIFFFYLLINKSELPAGNC